MKILLVTATRSEVQPFLDSGHNGKSNEIIHLETGVGMVATAYKMASYLAENRVDLLINAGIAGAVDASLTIAEVVEVTEELFYDFGAEDRDEFKSIFDLGLIKKDEFPFSDGRLVNNSHLPVALFPTLKTVKGITVQKVHGNESSIRKLKQRNPDAGIESMEGAAFFYAALLSGIPFVEIRAISNYVEPRNRETWEIGKAIENLNNLLINTLL